MAARASLRATVSLAAAALVLAVTAASASAGQLSGVQAHLTWSGVSTEDVRQELDVIKQSGADIVRVDVGWASLEEQGNGKISSWYLSKVDTVVEEAEARGLKLLLTFWETPCWASTAPSTLKQSCEGAWWDRGVQRYPPHDAGEYADALAFLVERYGSRVAAWEIWNEPNLPDFFVTDDQVGEYAKLVKAGYPAAKKAYPGATVVAGSLADADFEFTDALFRHGIKDKFDAWSVHPYTGDRSPLDPYEDKYVRHSFVRGVPAVREVLKRNGDAEPIWLTEFGWSTCTVRGQASYKNCVDESVQASYIGRAFRKMQSWSYVDAGIVYNHADRSSDADDRVDNYGLLRHDGSKKPAFRSFRAVAKPSGLAVGAKPSDLTVRAKPKSRGVITWGRAPSPKRVTIRMYRYRSGLGRYATKPRHRFRAAVTRNGRYRGEVPAHRLRNGKWKVTARAVKRTATTQVSWNPR